MSSSPCVRFLGSFSACQVSHATHCTPVESSWENPATASLSLFAASSSRACFHFWFSRANGPQVPTTTFAKLATAAMTAAINVALSLFITPLKTHNAAGHNRQRSCPVDALGWPNQGFLLAYM